MARSQTDSGKVMVQVRFTQDVFDRIKSMADQRGVTVASYVSYVAAETSMTHLQFSNAVGNLSFADKAHDGGADETPR